MSSLVLEINPLLIVFSNSNVLTRAALFSFVLKKENLKNYFIHITDQSVKGF